MFEDDQNCSYQATFSLMKISPHESFVCTDMHNKESQGLLKILLEPEELNDAAAFHLKRNQEISIIAITVAHFQYCQDVLHEFELSMEHSIQIFLR